MAVAGRSYASVPVISRGSLEDPADFGSRTRVVVIAAAADRRWFATASAMVARNPQAPVVAATGAPQPVVIAQAPDRRWFSASPVTILGNPQAPVVVPATATPGPVVVASQPPWPRTVQAFTARGTLADPPVPTTARPVVIAAASDPRWFAVSPARMASGGVASAAPPPPPPAFPLAPLDLRVELYMSGWQDISADVYQREGADAPVRISVGRGDEQASATPTTVAMEWNNRSGQFSPRNPTGPWYGLLGRNTPLRVSVPAVASASGALLDEGGDLIEDEAGDPIDDESAGAAFAAALRIADDAVSYASCPGSAALECSGDIDVRIDMDLDNWAPCLLAGQLEAPDGMYWTLSLNGDGTACFTWWDGSVVQQASSTMPVPLGRGAVRCWFDPAGTSGAPQVIFYTSPDMAGGWTQLGNAAAIASGDYAEASASAPLTVGYSAIWGATAAGAGQYGLQGRVYEARLWNDGTLAADPQFYAQTAGAPSFGDSQGNTWTLSGSAAIDDRAYRAHAECSTLPQRWDSTGSDVWTPVGGAGVLRRLQQGSAPAPSVMRRWVGAIAANPQWMGASVGATLAYWPGEDPLGSTQIASGLPGGRPMGVSGFPAYQGTSGSPSADGVFACSAQLAQPASSTWTGAIPVTSAAASAPSCNLYLLVCVPSGVAAATLASITLTGGGTISLLWNAGDLEVEWQLGTVETAGLVATGVTGAPMWVQVNAYMGGALATVTALTATGVQSGSTAITGAASSAMSLVTVNPGGAALGATEIGHLWAATSPWSGTEPPLDFGFALPWTGVLSGWNAETAANRVLRLCGEAGIAGRVYGYPDLSMPMGPQPIDTLANQLQYCESSDLGQLYEPLESLGIGYRTLGSMCSQPAGVTLDYAAAQIGDGTQGLEPEDDDQYTINDVIAARNNGSTVQVQITSGPMSVQPPPNGVGDYDTSLTVYNAWDKDLADIAGWAAWTGSANVERYPAVPLNLARPQLAALQGDILAMRPGGRFTIENLIAQMPPGDASQLAYGWTEGLGGFHWELSYNAVPEDPYDIPLVGTGAVATAGSELSAGCSPTATSLSVSTTAGSLWVTGAVDFNIMVAGEEMTVTNITGSSSPQAFTVARSVNGVAKSQASGAAVQVARPMVAALAGNRAG